MYTVFNMKRGPLLLPGGRYVFEYGTPRGRGLVEDKDLPAKHILWDKFARGEVLIVKGEVRTLEEALKMVPGFALPKEDYLIPMPNLSPNEPVSQQPTVAQKAAAEGRASLGVLDPDPLPTDSSREVVSPPEDLKDDGPILETIEDHEDPPPVVHEAPKLAVVEESKKAEVRDEIVRNLFEPNKNSRPEGKNRNQRR